MKKRFNSRRTLLNTGMFLTPVLIILLVTTQLLGVSFKGSRGVQVNAPTIQGGQLESEYHSYQVMRNMVAEWVKHYPAFVKQFELGKSVRGVPLIGMEITNTKTGAADEKPALLVVANPGGNEPIGSEVGLFLMEQAVGVRDSVWEKLLERITVYVILCLNPDGLEQYRGANFWWRGLNLEPFDDDRDEKIDEDGPDDLNNDGFITQMIVKTPNGDWQKDSADSRILVRRKENERGDYRLYPTEGIDNDSDGLINEDALGGVNLDRNFPAFWELNYRQPYSGVFQLSALEARALANFVLAHPNIACALIFGGAGGQLLRPFAGYSDDGPVALPAKDKQLFNAIGERFKKICPGEEYGAANLKIEKPGFGSLLDWLYLHQGIIAFVYQPWSLPADTVWNDTTTKVEQGKEGKEKRAKVTEKESEDKKWLEFSDQKLSGRGFVNWTKVKHPTLGEVEVGGFKPLVKDNPPETFLKETCQKAEPLVKYLAGILPQVQIEEVTRELRGKDILRLTAKISNAGFLPSLSEQGARTQTVPPTIVSIELSEGVELLEGERRVQVGVLDKNQVPKMVTWVVQKIGARSRVTIKLWSPKGGMVTRRIEW